MELRKVASTSYAVKTRFDFLPQPIIIDTAPPQYDHMWHRENKEEIDALGIVMDHLAMSIIRTSLGSDLVVGDEVRFSQVACIQC
jgi:hypothetical protein